MAQSGLSQALEREAEMVRDLERALKASGSRGGRYSLQIDRHYRRLFELLQPRIAWLTRRYGLANMAEDAEQVCAIAIHRAVQAWEPDKASFSTLAHWQMRGELQSLRHRMMLDQRQSARTAGVRTVAWHNKEGTERAEVLALAESGAHQAAERGASDFMARATIDRLLDGIDSPTHERALVLEHLFGEGRARTTDRKTREQHRQIVRRTFRNGAKVVM